MGRFQTKALCRELGAELRRCRKAAGMSGTELAEKLGWDHSKVSRMETGHINANDVDVVTYLITCGLDMHEVQEFLYLCQEAEHDYGYWLRRTVHSLIYHESTAIASTSYEPQLIPGLFQTESYARVTIGRYGPHSVENLEFCVRARLRRQQVMHLKDAGQFTFFLHEHALQRETGNAAIMHEQLLALMLADSLPNVAVRVVPAKYVFGGSFRLLRYAKHNPLVYLDSHVGGLFLEDAEDVDHYLALVARVDAVALNEGQSREVLATLASSYDRGSSESYVEEEQL